MNAGRIRNEGRLVQGEPAFFYRKLFLIRVYLCLSVAEFSLVLSAFIRVYLRLMWFWLVPDGR